MRDGGEVCLHHWLSGLEAVHVSWMRGGSGCSTAHQAHQALGAAQHTACQGPCTKDQEITQGEGIDKPRDTDRNIAATKWIQDHWVGHECRRWLRKKKDPLWPNLQSLQALLELACSTGWASSPLASGVDVKPRLNVRPEVVVVLKLLFKPTPALNNPPFPAQPGLNLWRESGGECLSSPPRSCIWPAFLAAAFSVPTSNCFDKSSPSTTPYYQK